MKSINTIFVLLLLLSWCTSSTAQVVKQHGIVRKITHSKTDPVVPVEGIRIVIDGISSSNSNREGIFYISLKHNGIEPYRLDDVRVPKNRNFILAYPELKSKIYASKNDIVIALITPDEQQRISKENYNRLFRKYRQQGNELTQERNRLETLKMELSESDDRYKKVVQQLDSVQKTLNYYFDSSKKRDITKELKRIAMELTMTDYQSLDSVDAKLYELKRNGEWVEISKMLNKIMKGDAAAYMREGVEKKKAAEALLKAAEQNLINRLSVLEHAADSFMVLNKRDSVSKYYRIITETDSTNIKYLTKAARFECESMADTLQALKYLEKAVLYADSTCKADILSLEADIYVKLNRHDTAAVYFKKAEDIYVSCCDSEKLYRQKDLYTTLYERLKESGMNNDAKIYRNLTYDVKKKIKKLNKR